MKAVGAAVSADRPLDRAGVAILYGLLLGPTTALNTAARQIIASKGLSPTESARSLALVTMGIADSFIASFYNKYHYNFWRPETGIRNGLTDGNHTREGDPGFTTYSAPFFPSYPSNHGSATNGGLEVMRRLFGAADHDITLTATLPAQGSFPALVITRHYTQLKEIADDVSDARVYAGIHWPFDQVARRGPGACDRDGGGEDTPAAGTPVRGTVAHDGSRRRAFGGVAASQRRLRESVAALAAQTEITSVASSTLRSNS